MHDMLLIKRFQLDLDSVIHKKRSQSLQLDLSISFIKVTIRSR